MRSVPGDNRNEEIINVFLNMKPKYHAVKSFKNTDTCLKLFQLYQQRHINGICQHAHAWKKLFMTNISSVQLLEVPQSQN